MPIRYLETNYFKSPFVKRLSGKMKCFYSYVICDCTSSGIWYFDLDAARHFTGFEISPDEFNKSFVNTGKAIKIANDTFFFPDFIEHQYPGGLSDNNKAHKNILIELRKYKVIDDNNLPIKKAPLEDALQGIPISLPSNSNSNSKGLSNGHIPEMTKNDFDIFHDKILSDTMFTEPLFMTKGIKGNDALVKWLYHYDTHITGESSLRKDYAEYKRHFKNWINKQDTFKPAPVIQLQVIPKLATTEDVQKYRKHL
jgi:hypothetical protein